MAIISFILIKNFRKWGEFGLNTHKDNLVNQDEYTVGGDIILFQIQDSETSINQPNKYFLYYWKYQLEKLLTKRGGSWIKPEAFILWQKENKKELETGKVVGGAD